MAYCSQAYYNQLWSRISSMDMFAHVIPVLTNFDQVCQIWLGTLRQI